MIVTDSNFSRDGEAGDFDTGTILDELSSVEVLCHCIDIYGEEVESANKSTCPRKAISYETLVKVSKVWCKVIFTDLFLQFTDHNFFHLTFDFYLLSLKLIS